MMLFDDLRDNEWALVEALFCAEPARSERRGRPRVEARAVVNAVLWVLSTGEGWSKLPGRYPSPPTCRRRFDEWQADGTLAEIVKRLGTTAGKFRCAAALARPRRNRRHRRAATVCAAPSGPIRNRGARRSRWPERSISFHRTKEAPGNLHASHHRGFVRASGRNLGRPPLRFLARAASIGFGTLSSVRVTR